MNGFVPHCTWHSWSDSALALDSEDTIDKDTNRQWRACQGVTSNCKVGLNEAFLHESF